MSKARKDDYLQMDKTDPDVAKRIRGEVSRLQRRVPMLDGRHYLARFENVIIAYLNTNRDAEYHPAMVSLCAPFIYVLNEEWDAYYCFEQVMQALGEDLLILSKRSINVLHEYIDEHYTMNTVKESVAKFMTLFRYVLPELQVSFIFDVTHSG